MQKIYYTDENFEEKINSLYNRPGFPAEVLLSATEIVENVRKYGDKAVEEYLLKFDKANVKAENFLVKEDEINQAIESLDIEAKNAIDQALKQVQDFARETLPKNWNKDIRDGVMLGEKFSPLSRVGVYIPGGTAPLVSTVIHTAGIASVAGVKEIVAVTPPNKDGKVHPAVLYAMKQAGVTEIYRLGGVYAVAAIGIGTKTIRKVEKIFGPGNAYVTAAKKLLYGEIAIDMVAGPSEILVLAEKNSNAKFIAADMLSQAEHGSGLEQSVLVSTDRELLDKVELEINEQKKLLSREDAVDKVLAKGTFLIHAKDKNNAIEIANKYAPEHLEVLTENPEQWAEELNAAGAIFLGEWTPEPIGDFCAGPSHVLPTASSAKFFNGIETSSFFRRSSTIKYSQNALQREVKVVEKIAQLEGLTAHGRAGSIRFEE